MPLTRQEIYYNYQQCLNTVIGILESRYAWKFCDQGSLNDLAQSVVGDQLIVQCLQTEPFQPERLNPLLLERIDAVRKIFLPDLKKSSLSPFLITLRKI
jgi:hypothetical protein